MPMIALSELTRVATEWLWPGWLAAGYLHVLDGDPGVGKSLLTADLAARLSTGRPWPDGAPSSGPGTVMLLNAEDDAAGATRDRVTAAEGDLGRVMVWRSDLDESSPLLPHGLGPLADAIHERRPRLVVIDPVSAFLDRRVNMHSDHAIRRALAPLAALAATERCAVLLIRHLSKQSGGRPLYRGLGSIGLIAASRIAWLAAHDPHDPSRTILANTKINLATAPPSLAYRVTCGGADAAASAPTCRDTEGLPGQDGAATPPPRLVWLGPTSATAADLLGSRAASESPRHRARRFLAELLKGGPLLAGDVGAAARPKGHSVRTLRRAARDLDITFRKIGNQIIGQSVYWLLPGQQVPREALDPNGIELWLEQLDAANAGKFPKLPIDRAAKPG